MGRGRRTGAVGPVGIGEGSLLARADRMKGGSGLHVGLLVGGKEGSQAVAACRAVAWDYRLSRGYDKQNHREAH